MIEQEYNIASSLIEKGSFEQAAQRLKAILMEDNQYYPALNKLGVIHANQRKHESAKEYFKQALEVNPDYAPAYVNLGNLHMEAGHYQQAIEYYEKALRSDEDYCFAYYNLAIAYKKLGDYGKYILNIKTYRKTYTKELRQHKFQFLKALSGR